LYPIQSISQLLGRVLFPAFAELQDDEARFRRVYLRACAGIALITFPLMAGLAVVSDLFIYVLLGTKWLPVAPLVSILAPVGMVQSIGTTVGQIYTAKARTDWLFRWGIASSCVYLCGFAVGLPYGARGVALGYATTTALLLWPMFSIPFRLIHLSMREFLSTLWRRRRRRALPDDGVDASARAAVDDRRIGRSGLVCGDPVRAQAADSARRLRNGAAIVTPVFFARFQHQACRFQRLAGAITHERFY
jgi:hypothetical protein